MEDTCDHGLSRRSLSVESRYDLSWNCKLMTTKTNVQYSPDEIESPTIRVTCRSVFDPSYSSTQNYNNKKSWAAEVVGAVVRNTSSGDIPIQNTCCDSKKVGLKYQAPSLSVPCPCRTRSRGPAHTQLSTPPTCSPSNEL